MSYVDDMKLIIKCTIVLHIMVLEERCFAVCEGGEEKADGVIVGKCRPTMWKGLVQLQGAMISAAPGTVAASFEVEEFKENKAEHDLTKMLHVNHLWNIHRSAKGKGI